LNGLNLPRSTVEELLRVDSIGWLNEAEISQNLFKSFGARFPEKLWQEYSKLMDRLNSGG
jgi:GTP-dependent phosphoenolpyruvate carboxykinase